MDARSGVKRWTYDTGRPLFHSAEYAILRDDANSSVESDTESDFMRNVSSRGLWDLFPNASLPSSLSSFHVIPSVDGHLFLLSSPSAAVVGGEGEESADGGGVFPTGMTVPQLVEKAPLVVGNALVMGSKR